MVRPLALYTTNQASLEDALANDPDADTVFYNATLKKIPYYDALCLLRFTHADAIKKALESGWPVKGKRVQGDYESTLEKFRKQEAEVLALFMLVFL